MARRTYGYLRPAGQPPTKKRKYAQPRQQTTQTQPAKQAQPATTVSQSDDALPQKKSTSTPALDWVAITMKFDDMVQEITGEPHLIVDYPQDWGNYCAQAKTDPEKAAAVRFIEEALKHRNIHLKRLYEESLRLQPERLL